MSPGQRGTTRQMRREARRRSEKSRGTAGDGRWLAGDASGVMSRWEVLFAVVASACSLTLTGVAWAVDIRSFQAVATPELYCWIGLCVVVVFGGLVAAAAVYGRVPVPWYFRVALVAGAVVGVLTVDTAWRILTKEEAQPREPIPAAHVDLRNQVVTDRSFAEGNMRRSELSGATFRHVDFSGADLSESDLRNARFEDVDLSGAKLCGVDLRGADLTGARGVDAVADWSYVFYDRHTRVPRSDDFILAMSPGPIPDTGRDLLYMCKQDVTRRIEG